MVLCRSSENPVRYLRDRRSLGRQPFMGIFKDTMDRLKFEATGRYKNAKQMAEALGKNPNLFSRWFSGERKPRFEELAEVLDAMGARILFLGDRPETTRDVCWVDAKVVAAGEGQPMPLSESYFAVPLVGEAGAGPGVMSDDTIKSWVLVYRHQHAVRLKSNLLAVEIGKGSTSMTPLLCPGDIILVDRDDFKPAKPGGIFLVREPGQQGGAMIKRVAVKPVDHDLLITFYSENTAENPPETFSLRADYNDKITDAIVGRCVWAWSDITGK